VLPASVGRCRRYIEGTDLATMINSITSVSGAAVLVGSRYARPGPWLGPPTPPAPRSTPSTACPTKACCWAVLILKYKNGPAGEWNEINIGFSRDGFYWDRTNRVPVATSINTTAAYNNPANWNEGNVQSVGGAVVDVGDETWMYTSGRTSAADTAGLWIWRKGRFASLDAGGVEAQTTGRWQVPTGSPTQFFVNANAAGGSLKVEFLDGGGQVISAFSKANCNAVAVDSTDVQVTWAGAPSLSAIAGQRIKPRFYGTNAKISGYRYA
jgi:hypothetical protein